MLDLYWYYLPTGEIVGFETNTKPPSESYILAHEGSRDYSKHYVYEGRIITRPSNPAVLIDTTLSALPTPCMIIINGKPYECTDDTAEVDFTYPGVYKIKVVSFPFLDIEFEVTT